MGCPSTQASALTWGLPSCCVNSTDGNSLIRPSRVFSDGGGRCVGLLGETRSPENQQSRGSCPGAPAPGTPKRRVRWDWQGAQSQRNCALAPFFWPLGDTVLTFLQGAGRLPLIPSSCSGQGRHSSEWLLLAWGLPSWGPGRELCARNQGQGASYCSALVSCECILCSLVPLFSHPSNGRDHTCHYPAVSLPFNAVLAYGGHPINSCQMKL